jgi:diguanylate cyclase (GGDEF)-like protein
MVHRFLLGLLLLCRAAVVHAGTPEQDFARDLASAREQAYVTPGETLRKLESLKQGRSGHELGLVLVEMSRAYYWHGDKNEAVDAARQAEKLGQDLHDDALRARAMLGQGLALSSLVHDQEAAHQMILQAAALADRTKDTELQTRARVAQGLLAEEDGRDADALEFLSRAVALARFGNDPDGLSLALREQARLLAGAGNYDEAMALTDEVLAIARRGASDARLAQARLSEYAIAARAGRASRAESALDAAVAILEKLGAKERLAVPLANLAELYIQSRRYGAAWRSSTAALRIARELGDENAMHLASFELGMTHIYLREIAHGRDLVDNALASLSTDERYVRMLLDYGHALNQVGEGDVALTVYEKASSVSLAAWRKEKQLAYQALRRAYDYQKKQSELAKLHHESALKAADLENTRRQRSLWVLLTGTALVAAIVIAFLLRRVVQSNRALHLKNDQLFRQSTRDSLTGLFNRHYFYERVVPQHHRKAPLAGPDRRSSAEGNTGGVFLLMDIDRFKSINDSYGHSAGDAVLKTVAERLSSALREEDVLIRWGGEEFLAFLPGIGTGEAGTVCARLLEAVSAAPIPIDGRTLTVTISIGFCPKPVEDESTDPDWEKLVHLADLCLYLSKTGGRNQAFGISDGRALTQDAIAAADADLKQASADGLVELVNVTA